MITLGLDISARSTGMVLMQSTAQNGTPTVLLEDIITVKSTGMQRCSDQAEKVLSALETYPPDLAAIEGVGGRFLGSILPQHEVNTVIRYFLRQLGYHWLEVAPNAVKKFALGKGTGDKSKIMMNVLKRWGHEAKNDDTADAYVLGCIAMAHGGHLKGLTQPMIEVVGSLKVY